MFLWIKLTRTFVLRIRNPLTIKPVGDLVNRKVSVCSDIERKKPYFLSSCYLLEYLTRVYFHSSVDEARPNTCP
jgi:hypothetical protein